MMRRYLMTGVFSLGLIGGAMVSAYAGTGADTSPSTAKTCPCPKKGHFMENLTEEQRQVIHEVMEAHKTEFVRMKMQLKELMQERKAAIESPDATPASVKALAEQMNIVFGNMNLLKAQADLEIYQKTGVLMPMPMGQPHHHRGMHKPN